MPFVGSFVTTIAPAPTVESSVGKEKGKSISEGVGILKIVSFSKMIVCYWGFLFLAALLSSRVNDVSNILGK